MEWDTAAAHAVLKGAGGNVWRLDTLQELSYGKVGMENPFFVAAGNDIALRSYNEEPQINGVDTTVTCFETHDVRGASNVNFDADIPYIIGHAVAQKFQAKKIVGVKRWVR